MKIFYYLLAALVLSALTSVKFPQAEITNDLIHAKLYLPDSYNGYYQGTRFDWGGVVSSLTYNGHDYFGRWFLAGNPEVHDTIMGPVEEFAPLDYPETKPGGSFLKIGVGTLSKLDDKPYSSGRIYPILNHGKWIVKKQTDQVRFIHELNDKEYSYLYKRSVRLLKDKPEMVVDHTLRNTGKRSIETSVYAHNFFVIDKQPIGPGFSVAFPFSIKGEGPGFGELAEIKENKILFLRNLRSGETVYCDDLRGFSRSAKDCDIRVENWTTGAGVRIISDQPLVKLAFWACSTTLCPEPYLRIEVEPGKEFSWRISYEFYSSQK